MHRLVKQGRVIALVLALVILLTTYVVFLYKLQIIEGEKYYNQSREIKNEERTVTAARGNILDRYGRVLVSNSECYNLTIDTTKLFANEDPNATILGLVQMVQVYGDSYTDDLPITKEPPFEYTDMTEIQKTMLDAYIEDKAKFLPEDPTAVELMAFMRGRYEIDNSYSAEEMRIIAGVRYSINVRYAINTADYVFVEDASMQLITTIMERKLAGIEVNRAYVREYGTDYAAHILGYTGLMTQEEYEKYSLLDYSTDAMVGKDGVEYAFENELHGQDGKVIETKNNAGTVLSTVYTKEPVPGNHVYLTIDITLQEQVERILNAGVQDLIKTREQKRAEGIARGDYNPDMKDEITGAAAVVVDVNTGEPLAMASWPTYDVSTIIDNYQELLNTANAPLFNRALMGAYAPGSTFKPCTAIASLDKGIINTEDKIKCQGVYTRYSAEGYSPECWIWNATSEHLTHPEENVTTAIRDSCNYFFYTIGNDLGVDDLGEYAHKFGLGVPTGIELVETTGNMSNRTNHSDFTGTEWRIGDTLQAAIGQSDSIFTPLQMAEFVATVANKGTRHSASILKTVRSFDYSKKLYEREPEVMSTVDTADYNWAAVQEGMRLVVNSPLNLSNYELFSPCKWIVAGKTGTAQKGENITNDGMFICFAPFSRPEVAVSVVVERGGSGAEVAFIARHIMDAYIVIQSYSDSSETEMMLLK
ncbi:MAG: penicillin-binding transpeptidase domain-containing protein [Candidatus Limivicinus sp.]|jgi:penicillin-binding protein 2